MSIVCFIASLLVLGVSTWYDLTSERVPNVFVLPCIAAGLIAQPFFIPFTDYLIRLGIVCGIYFLYEGFIGAGDAKLVMMITILCGPVKGLGSLALASLGVLAVSLIRNPAETRRILADNWAAFRAMITEENAGVYDSIQLMGYSFTGRAETRMATVVF